MGVYAYNVITNELLFLVKVEHLQRDILLVR